MEYVLSKTVEPFLSKLGEKLVGYALGEKDTVVFKSLEGHLKLLSARASDFVEQIKKEELSGTKKRKRAVNCWLEQVHTVENEVGTLLNGIQTEGFVTKFFAEGQATNLDARVSELLEQSKDFVELVVDDHMVQGEEFLTEGLVGKEFEKNLENIWTLLVTEKVSCVGVYGMGGVGKTTLAKHINNRLLKESQNRVVWITVSQEYSVHMLQDEISKRLHIDISDLSDEDKRSTRLNKALSKINNVILIFDDVWDNIDLMKLGHPLSIHGCRLMITTRSRQVCHQIGCKKQIEVTKLSEIEAWILFKERHGRGVNLTPEVEEIAKSMVKMCEGLPLGIITLAGSMRGVTTKYAWEDVLAQLRESMMRQHDMAEKVFGVLKFSFDRLALRGEEKRNGYSKSQLCFLYCSTYPEDYEIDRVELIQRFITEDYLERKQSRKTLFNEGNTILDSLEHACLLEKGREGGVKMHDLLRKMALEINKSTRVFNGWKSSLEDIPNEELWTRDIEKIFLWNVRSEDISITMSPNCPKLSTLKLNLPDTRTVLPDLFFSQMHGLCTLDMSGSWEIEVLPNSLSDVLSLQALLFARCHGLKHVPNLGKLKRLKELDLTMTAIKEVPQGMEELINLKFLSFNETYFRKEIGLTLNFKNVQCLLLRGTIVQGEEVAGLKHLEEFCGRLKDVTHFLQLIRSRPNLAYKIEVGSTNWGFFDVDSLHYNALSLSAYDFKEAKDEDLTLFSKANIRHLELHECVWQSKCIIEDVSRMCNPASLESLSVNGGEGVECLMRREDAVVLSSLKRLRIYNCDSVKKLEVVASQLPILESLVIACCKEMEEMEVIIEENGIEIGIGDPAPAPAPAPAPVVVQSSISSIILNSNATASTSLSPPLAQTTFSSLKTLRIWDCKKMNKLGAVASQFPNLERLDIGKRESKEYLESNFYRIHSRRNI